MSSTAWKQLEARVAAAWGGRRRGVYRAGCDVVDTPVAIECKRSKRRVPEGRWIAQAEAQGRDEGLPWLLVVGGHRDRAPIAVCDHGWLVELARSAGLIDATAAGTVRRSRAPEPWPAGRAAAAHRDERRQPREGAAGGARP